MSQKVVGLALTKQSCRAEIKPIDALFPCPRCSRRGRRCRDVALDVTTQGYRHATRRKSFRSHAFRRDGACVPLARDQAVAVARNDASSTRAPSASPCRSYRFRTSCCILRCCLIRWQHYRIPCGAAQEKARPPRALSSSISTAPYTTLASVPNTITGPQRQTSSPPCR